MRIKSLISNPIDNFKRADIQNSEYVPIVKA